MYTIAKVFEFSAAHCLDLLPTSHPCSRVHGHNYTVTIIFESEGLNEFGFVIDYRDLDRIKKIIDEKFDHRSLNTFMLIPTAELIATYIFKICREMWPETAAVRVSETPKTWAEYRE